MQCSNCGALNNEGVTACWSCGASLAPGVGQEYAQPEHVQCSNCGALNNQGVTACWSCGAGIVPGVGQEYAQPEHVQCSNCGALNNQGVTACWSCGAGIAPGVGQSPPVQNYLVWTIVVTVVTVRFLLFPLASLASRPSSSHPRSMESSPWATSRALSMRPRRQRCGCLSRWELLLVLLSSYFCWYSGWLCSLLY